MRAYAVLTEDHVLRVEGKELSKDRGVAERSAELVQRVLKKRCWVVAVEIQRVMEDRG